MHRDPLHTGSGLHYVAHLQMQQAGLQVVKLNFCRYIASILPCSEHARNTIQISAPFEVENKCTGHRMNRVRTQYAHDDDGLVPVLRLRRGLRLQQLRNSFQHRGGEIPRLRRRRHRQDEKRAKLGREPLRAARRMRQEGSQTELRRYCQNRSGEELRITTLIGLYIVIKFFSSNSQTRLISRCGDAIPPSWSGCRTSDSRYSRTGRTPGW